MNECTNHLSKDHGFKAHELSQYLEDFCLAMRTDGFTELTINGYVDAVAHLGTWLHNQSIVLENLDHRVLKHFSQHRCSCLGYPYTQLLSLRYMKRVQKFMAYLRTRKVISGLTIGSVENVSPWDRESFSLWLSAERGLAPITVGNYLRRVDRALPMIGYKTDEYTATTIRRAITELAKRAGSINVKPTITALRAYFRYLQVKGLCRSDLIAAVPTIPHWRLSSLPRYISA